MTPPSIIRSFKRRQLAMCVAAVATTLLSASSAFAGGATQPTVVELFTSQGCSSCPPANANLIKLSTRPDVLALSFGVTYWDRLGWKDIFAKPEFTTRQRVYEPALNQTGPFTPQVVVDGRADVVGNRLGEIEALISDSHRQTPPGIDITDQTVRIDAGPAPASAADVWLVRYDPRTIEVDVGRGENTGRTLPHKNVVRELTRIGSWNGNEVSLAVHAPVVGLKVAVLVQAPNGGPILAAQTD